MTLSLPLQPDERRARWTIFLLAAVVLTSFALFTDHRWEDYYITFRSSKNLANGHGLVYQVGERVHTFTSPLGVLLPALASAVTGGQHDEAALWLFRAMSIAAFGFAAVLVWDATGAWGWPRVSRLFVVAALCSDAKSIDYSINGMETAFMLLFLACTLHALATGGPGGTLRLGVGWAGLMWTRPDSCIYIAALGLTSWLFLRGQNLATTRAALFRCYLRAGLITSLLYLPWLVSAWLYYGSPIPHTIIAKGLGLARPELLTVLVEAVKLPFAALRSTELDGTFAPAYYAIGGWAVLPVQLGRGMMWLALVGFLLPGARPEMRLTSAAYFISACYCRNIWLFPWYLPPSAFLAIMTLGGWSEWLFRQVARLRWPRILAHLPFAAMIALTSLFTVNAAWQLRLQQRIVEGHRQRIGLWLKENSPPAGASVFLEPIGYIGFFSGLKILDYPGLTAPEVVAARRASGSHWHDLIRVLQPDWVVARPGELTTQRLPSDPDYFAANYRRAITFSVADEVAALSFVPGRKYLQVDAVFEVYQRLR